MPVNTLGNKSLDPPATPWMLVNKQWYNLYQSIKYKSTAIDLNPIEKNSPLY
jgi:hypothetical protein